MQPDVINSLTKPKAQSMKMSESRRLHTNRESQKIVNESKKTLEHFILVLQRYSREGCAITN